MSEHLGNTVDVPHRAAPPVGTLAFVTALYGVLYLVWEQSHWGSAEFRDLLGNVAFMPLNVGVSVLFALASRNKILDPGVRRALRLLATGAAMVFIGNTISVWYVEVLHQNPPVSWADPFYLSDSLLTLTALLAFRWRGAPGSSAGSSCSTPRWCWSAAGWRSGTSRSA